MACSIIQPWKHNPIGQKQVYYFDRLTYTFANGDSQEYVTNNYGSAVPVDELPYDYWYDHIDSQKTKWENHKLNYLYPSTGNPDGSPIYPDSKDSALKGY